LFAWRYWTAVNNRFTVSWSEFQEWELWMLAATFGLDKRARTNEEQALIDKFNAAAAAGPSPDRKG
jgi:hypothetical protein